MAKVASINVDGKSKVDLSEPSTTQRAYTLRLRGIDKSDHAWRDAVWATHEAVNNGAKVFGDWMLTMRGGLDHSFADLPRLEFASAEGKKKIADELKELAETKNKDELPPTEQDPISEITKQRDAVIRDRRILLALSWLSVESSTDERDSYRVVAKGKDSPSSRNEKVMGALRSILAKRGVAGDDLESWMDDCEPSISAAIRHDAVWVNRSEMFDRAQQLVGDSLTREEIWDLLEPFFGSREAYLTPIASAEDSDESGGEEDKAKDLVQKAGQWLSSRFGTGGGANFSQMAKVYRGMVAWASNARSYGNGELALQSLAESLIAFTPKTNDGTGILKLIGGPGYKSATRNIIGKWQTQSALVAEGDVARLKESAAGDAAKCESNTGGKGRRPYSDTILDKVQSACGLTYLQEGGPARHSEFAVMLDHAGRRVSIGHTWIKRAESERQKFKADSEKIERLPADIRAWLDHFCAERFQSSGAIEPYRIRRRAVGGWKEIVARWARIDGMSAKAIEELASTIPPEGAGGTERSPAERARIASAREVQADPEIDKFGDIQLFEALAADEAAIIWRVNDQANPQPLLDYAAATDALAKQKRFKVPAYRHPDPLSHPVFCDFGNSRWDIRFAVHDAHSKLADAKAIVERREKELTKAKERVVKAKTAEKKTEAESKLKQAEDDLHEVRETVAWLSHRHALSMGLWDGGTINNQIPLRWSCKRLTSDMGMRNGRGDETAVGVTRGDRLGRAAAGVGESSAVSILGVFDQADWNGRLQAPRCELDAIAKQFKKTNTWNEKATRMRDRISWLVSFSAKLQQAGPWFQYSAAFAEDAPAKPFVSRRGEYAIKHTENEKRAGEAKLILSRLPGLRILSVDLGHRFAAGCAVWETLTIQQMRDACGREPLAGELFIHVKRPTEKFVKKGGRKGQPIIETSIFRRIGADRLPDGTPHPAPWAKLDRQFLIKLPGEEKPARAASREVEMRAVSKLVTELGLVIDEDHKPERAVDELMSRAVRDLALALKRHGRRVKIAHAMNPKTNTIPAMGGNEKSFTPGDKEHLKLLTGALVDWHALASESKWNDASARALWNEHIVPLGAKPAESQPVDPNAEQPTRQHRKKDEEALRDALQPVVAILAARKNDAIHSAWVDRWTKDDGRQANVPAVLRDQKGPAKTSVTTPSSGWYAHLRLLTDWIMGRRMSGIDSSTGWQQNVGGLSLDRIATMKSLYQLHKAFAMRSKPDKPCGAPNLGETNRGLVQSILNAMEQMREQRVKQIASRIAGAALGLGGHWKHVDTRRKNPVGMPKMKWVWVDEPTAKYRPCHAVVIENLTNYRPDELQTRRENRQLMTWSSAKVKKYLSEACQLHGLHLREVKPGYTSRQDSRTGAPGMRCNDVSVDDFMNKPWWRRQVKQAIAKGEKGDAREQWLVSVEEEWSSKSSDDRKAALPIRIPVKGGEIFVSADRHSPLAKGLQADLNAAANIGLKALMDPDWAGKWWFVPCESATNRPHPDKTRGSAAIKPDMSLVKAAVPDAESADAKPAGSRRPSKLPKKQREIINLWRDISDRPIDFVSQWINTTAYWNLVRASVVTSLCNPKSLDAKQFIEAEDLPW